MKDKITGKAYVLGDDVDTDQIIPAEYLVYDPTVPEERKLFGKYALASVPPGQMGLPDGHVPFVNKGEVKSDYAVIIAGRTFGCGSSTSTHVAMPNHSWNCRRLFAIVPSEWRSPVMGVDSSPAVMPCGRSSRRRSAAPLRRSR